MKNKFRSYLHKIVCFSSLYGCFILCNAKNIEVKKRSIQAGTIPVIQNEKEDINDDFIRKQTQLFEDYKKKINSDSTPNHNNPTINIKVKPSIIKTNTLVTLVVKRGILAPNKTWWIANDYLLKDKSGVEFYRDIKSKNKHCPFIPLNIVGKKIYLVDDINCIKELMDNSPYTFGVGKIKKKMFKSFMEDNLGISEGKEWRLRRNLNNDVLCFNELHKYASIYNTYLKQYLEQHSPKGFDDFLNTGKYAVTKIVFNKKVPPEVFQIFSEANCLKAIVYPNFQIKKRIKEKYDNFLIENIKNPQKNSLIDLATKSEKLYCPVMKKKCINEIKAQIPHWIFPILGQFHSVIPRLLLLINNHKKVLKKLREEITSVKNIDAQTIHNMKYLRYCVLEMVRLNNAVVTSFRTLKRNYKFKNGYSFPQGTQFLVLNNPVLREKEFFVDPDKFCPQRWSIDGMEDSYYSIMFNQGPQKCPGKELAIFLAKSYIVNFLIKVNFKYSSNKINTSYIEQMINPYKIKFEY